MLFDLEKSIAQWREEVSRGAGIVGAGLIWLDWGATGSISFYF